MEGLHPTTDRVREHPMGPRLCFSPPPSATASADSQKGKCWAEFASPGLKARFQSVSGMLKMFLNVLFKGVLVFSTFLSADIIVLVLQLKRGTHVNHILLFSEL